MISLTVVSGRSGSGKSTALNILEDLGHYCIDNLPISLLQPLTERLAKDGRISQVAVGIDARNTAEDLALFAGIFTGYSPKEVEARLVYLDADSGALVKRFSETRRKHPLSSEALGLREALELETQLLDPIAALAHLKIDTSALTVQELRDQIRARVAPGGMEFALLFQSFAYKAGVPVDADLVFDVRCLPNPHWQPELRSLTGLDKPVQKFLLAQSEFRDMYKSIHRYLAKWLPRFADSARSYLTVAVGCTGGQHRSVFMCAQLHEAFKSRFPNVQLRHRELGLAQAGA